jgi:chemotaxis protein methyltransferase CheR
MPHLHLGLLGKRRGDIPLARRELSSALALLEHENEERLLLFGGGFTREALRHVCRAELSRSEAKA